MQNKNMNNLTETKLSENKSVHRPVSFFTDTINPKREWLILVILFFILTLATAGFDFYIYRQVVNGDMYISVNREDITIENLKTIDLQKILDGFENKKNIITNLKLKNLVDPSI